MKEIEDAFSNTTGVILGKKLVGIEDYSSWLSRGLFGTILESKSTLSGKLIHLSSLFYFEAMMPNAVTQAEALVLGEKHISEEQVQGLSLENASSVLKDIKATTPEMVFDVNIGTEKCGNYGPSQYCFKSSLAWFAKFCAYSFWPRSSEYVFGCSATLFSEFCIKCFDSSKLKRCFEVSDAINCSDCYFSHNLENCQECLFCFNVKNKRFAVGNVELPREEYLKVKQLVLKQITEELEKTKTLRRSVNNLGARTNSA